MSATIIPIESQAALCAQTDPEIFFPSKGDSAKPAKTVCAQCPLIMPCLTFALKNKEEYGIWGGAGTKERRTLRTKPQVIAYVTQLKNKYGKDTYKEEK
jgi:hypothetical protein